ncbi:hypothetical protein [Spirosoma foliorum]|uniref:Uncharacterized protein n=1 Tax=Spirosoma foliorum TaxID=2710596 RepID=A0A7G5GTT8_9BACT|nr:hypothetical protein [Spirosoma foliorum]QMW02280.1 hypothetical protein H3H32_30885 [Spirosoma foliorum]
MKEELDASRSIIDSIPFNVWSILSSLLILTCSWLVAIYLIVPGFFHATPIYIYIITGFVLASLWYTATFTFAILQFTDSIDGSRYGPRDIDKLGVELGIASSKGWLIFYSTVAFCSFWFVGLTTFVWYVAQWRFRYLVAADFLVLGILFVPHFIYIVPAEAQTLDKK